LFHIHQFFGKLRGKISTHLFPLHLPFVFPATIFYVIITDSFTP
jgi:hypothetical protein